MKLSFILAGVGAVAAASTLVIAHVVQKPSPDSSTATAFPAVETNPTPQYLLAHPDVFREAERRCSEGSAPSALYCSNVHKAQSLRLADQYRRVLQSGTVSK